MFCHYISRWGLLFVVVLLACACSSTKHVPAGKYLLDNVKIEVEGDKSVKPNELYNFLRQKPNHEVFGFARLQLSIYSLSGEDSTHWGNKWLRKLGQAPVIYSNDLTEGSRRQLRLALLNRGYMDATVEVDSVMHPKRKRADVVYKINTGQPHIISSFDYNIADSAVSRIIEDDIKLVAIAPGDLFDRNRLDNVRTEITKRLRNEGYYTFNREYISFTADTARNSKDIDLTMNIRNDAHQIYHIRSITFVTEDAIENEMRDTVDYRNIRVVYGKDRYIKPSSLYEMCFLAPGQRYNLNNIEQTYTALSRLSILRFVNIEMRPAADGAPLLDAVINISRNKKQSVSVEVEATNSEGDFGFGLGATYSHHNIAHSSRQLTVKANASYQSVSGDLSGFINNRYSEYSGEIGLISPKFELPFASRDLKKRLQATTEYTASFNYQEHPEYTRIIAGLGWRWKWDRRKKGANMQHLVDILNFDYVRMPELTNDFYDQLAPLNPLLRYAYEDHLIMRLGYTFQRSNRSISANGLAGYGRQPYISTLRLSAETAGNLLYLGNELFSGNKKPDAAYKVFGIQFAQYLKGEFDYSFTRNFNSRHSLGIHVGLGIAYPYGNSSMVPFEKRFYAGGANGVRGWGVRTLGPGKYDSRNSVADFMNQSGDISFILNLEYRIKLFWLLEGALFADAGNIWTIQDYPNQPGGVFKFNEFYKQIAASYGAGLRLDFTYFVIRLDLGMKAHNPAMNQERWPLIHPKFSRDANFHITVGYPF